MDTSVGLHIFKRFKKYLVPSELCVDWKGFCRPIYWSLSRPLILQTSEIAKKSNSYNSKSNYNAHTHPLFRRLNLQVKDIFMLNILKVYYKYQEKSLPSYTANMFSVATYASNYNLGVTKSLTNVHTKTINDDKCIRSDLPKVINDKMATLSYQGFAFYSKRVTIAKYNQDCHLQNCYVCKQRSNWYVH